MPDRHLPQPVNMKRRRRAKATLYDHAVSAASFVMAGRAENIESLSSSLQHLFRDWRREAVDQFAALLAFVKVLIDAQLATRHSPGNDRPGCAVISKKRILLQRLESWLIVHILATGGQNQTHEHND